MRPGPNCFTRGSSVMLLSSLTIAILQKRKESHVGRRRRKSEDQIRRERVVRAICAFRIRRDGASGDLKRYRRQCAGAARAALTTTTRTSTHKDDLCNLNLREDRPVPRRCKGKSSRK